MDREAWQAIVHGVAKSWTRLSNTFTLQAYQGTQIHSLGLEDPLEKEMATHSSILA